jgi:hypothetical protein
VSAIPLSANQCWNSLRSLYASRGVEAWNRHLPFHITSNPHIADSYAQVVTRFAQDLHRAGKLVPEEPLYVLELGAGPGKFAFHFLRRIGELRSSLNPGPPSVRYVMTDVSESNAAHWLDHPRLQPYLDDGSLFAALLDVQGEGLVRLAPLDRPGLQLETFANPLVVIANYVLDSLPQDAFRVSGSTIWQGLTSGDMGSATFGWVEEPAGRNPYGDADLDAVLVEQAGAVADGSFLFPLGALRGLRRILKAATGGMLLLAGDLDVSGLDTMPGLPELPASDGSDFFYFPVDLSLVGRFLARLGAPVVRHYPSLSLGLLAVATGSQPDELAETIHACDVFLGRNGPQWFGAAGRAIEETGAASLDHWLSAAAALCFDPYFLEATIAAVRAWAQPESLSPRRRERLAETLERIRAEVYWIPGSPDSYFTLAMLYQEMDCLDPALVCYRDSLAVTGPSADTFFNMGLCERGRGRPEEALGWMARAVDLDPQHVLARGWIAQIALESDPGSSPG